MAKKCFLFLWLILFSFYGADVGKAQRDASQLHVDVVLVQLNVAVTDSKGNYISGLRPEDFIISEDNIPQKTATFEEGNEAPRRLLNVGSGAAPAASTATMVAAEPPSTAEGLPSTSTGSNVFILFDTSNYMYRGFVFAQDSISDFVRALLL
jgi:Ca-activated chloride channel family protein